MNLIVFYKRPNRSMVAMRGMSQVSQCRSQALQTDTNPGGFTDQWTVRVKHGDSIFTFDIVDSVICVGGSLRAVPKGGLGSQLIDCHDRYAPSL